MVRSPVIAPEPIASGRVVRVREAPLPMWNTTPNAGVFYPPTMIMNMGIVR
jgi:hypothetical protein